MPASALIPAGTTVGRYEIVGRLSAGGMGEVYRAYDPLLERPLVLKVLPEASVARKDALERFTREARAASALNHPNIITIYEIGESGGFHFIAMELVRGRTLREIRSDSLPLRTVARVGAEAARALAVAHGAGIVHRDIKPENVMLRDDGYVKVLDFGIARLAARDDSGTADSRLTGAGMVVGTMRYMSPEQASAGDISPTSDIFSLGIVLYELATGTHPFEATSDMAVLSAILLREPLQPSRLNPRIPATLDKLFMEMLSKDPARRPSASEVEEVLRTLPDPDSGELAVGLPPARFGTLVGRDPERAALRESLANALSGHATMVCVSGEPGIGKTTLVEDFLAETRHASRALVARGRCSERLAGAEAYLPLLDAIEDLLEHDQSGELRQSLDAHAPAWRRQVAPTGETTPGAVSLGAASQERLKRELAGFTADLCRATPLVLLLEDIHWADAATVDVLSYLVTRLADSRLLVIVTFRPSELQLAQHPFLPLKLDLQTRGIARELPLSFLSEDEVALFLSRKFPGNDFPAELARVIHSRTEGQPLFVADVAEYLRTRKVIARDATGWTLCESCPDLERALPESVRSMVQRKIGQLDEQDRQLLTGAAVQGYSFDSAVLSAALGRDITEVEDRLSELDRVYAFVSRRAEHEFPDGTVTMRFRFVHVLYQNALYDSLAPSRRTALSKSVAEALLGFNEKNPVPVASELGYLFETGRMPSRAAEFYSLAARNAARVFANQEAVKLAQRGLTLLSRIDDAPDRLSRELPLQIILGTSLAVTRGYAAPDVLTAIERARGIAEQLGDRPQLAPVIWGLFAYYLSAANITEARKTADHFLRIARGARDPLLLVGAHTAMAMSRYYTGDLATGREHCASAAASYDRNNRPLYHALYRMDPGVFFYSEEARTLWLLGEQEKSLRSRDTAISLGEDSPDPRSRAFSNLFAALLHNLRLEPDAAVMYANRCIAVCDEHGIGAERAWAMPIRGWAVAAGGNLDEGLEEIEAGVAIQRASPSEVNLPMGLRFLAEARLWHGSLDRARDIANEGLALGERHRNVSSLGELHRILGEIEFAAAPVKSVDRSGRVEISRADFRKAESHFRRAIAVAAEQGALSLELRATVALAGMLRKCGDVKPAKQLVGEIRSRFKPTEKGVDLQRADAFLA